MKEFSTSVQIYICISCTLLVLVIVLALCVRAKKKRRTRRTTWQDVSKEETPKFVDVALRPSDPRKQSLSTFLESAQTKVVEEKSVVKQGLLSIINPEVFDTPNPCPRTANPAPRPSLAVFQKGLPIQTPTVPMTIYNSSDENLERQYKTVNASYKYQNNKELSMETIYANFETLTENLMKREAFGSEQLIATMDRPVKLKHPEYLTRKEVFGSEQLMTTTERPVINKRFSVRKSEEVLPSKKLEIAPEVKEKRVQYDYLHFPEPEKKPRSYENHEIIFKAHPRPVN